MTKEKSWTLQLLNQPVKYMASMFEKELKTYNCSLNLSCLHMVLEEKSTAHKFLSFPGHEINFFGKEPSGS